MDNIDVKISFTRKLKIPDFFFKKRYLFITFVKFIFQRVLIFALKVSSSERRRVVLLMESVPISPCGFICEREES